MTQNYYPWNIERLADWIRQEIKAHETIDDFSNAIGINTRRLETWLRSNSFDIAIPVTREQILAIAKFRRWPEEQVVSWLEIKPSHWQQILNADDDRH